MYSFFIKDKSLIDDKFGNSCNNYNEGIELLFPKLVILMTWQLSSIEPIKKQEFPKLIITEALTVYPNRIILIEIWFYFIIIFNK